MEKLKNGFDDEFTLDEIIHYLKAHGIEVRIQEPVLSHKSHESMKLSGLASLDSADSKQLSFMANQKYLSQLETTKAAGVFVKPALATACPATALITDNPYLAYAKASQFIRARRGDILDVNPGIHQSAYIAETAVLGIHVSIGPGVVIGEGSIIGDNVHIGANTVIGRHVSIGNGTKIASLVSIYDAVNIGENCRIHSNTTIGADGFGYAPASKGWEAIAQLGSVSIGDDVHIGANTSIDRGALNPTQIGHGVIIDNQVQIAHNVIVGEYTAIAGCAGIAGSTQIGARCTLAGAAGVAGHLHICEDVHIGMQAQVTKSIDTPGQYGSGTGLYPLKKWRRLVGRLRQMI